MIYLYWNSLLLIYLFTFVKNNEEESELWTVYYMYVWAFAYKHARCGQWHVVAIDNERFRNRIQKVEQILNPILEKKLQKIKQNE